MADSTTPPSATPEELKQGFENALDSSPQLRERMAKFQAAQVAPPPEAQAAQQEQQGAMGRMWSLLKTGYEYLDQPPPSGDMTVGEMGDTLINGVKTVGGIAAKAGSAVLDEGKKAIADPVGYRDQLAIAGTKGIARAADEGLKAAVTGGVTVSKVTGLYKLGRSEQEQQDFLKWYEKPRDQWNPTIGDTGMSLDGLPGVDEAARKAWLGPTRGGLPALVDGASQAAAGYWMGGRILKGLQVVPGLSGAAGFVLKHNLLGGGVQQALGDLLTVDQHGERLSNLMADAGPEFSKPFFDLLKAQPNDTDAEARLKTAMEGMFLGGTIETVGFLAKGLRLANQVRSGALSRVQAQAELEALKNIRGPVDDVVTIAETPEGHFEVRPASAKAPDTVPLSPEAAAETPKSVASDTVPLSPEAAAETPKPVAQAEPELKAAAGGGASPSQFPKFANRGDAESFAASFNFTAKHRRIPADRITEAQLQGWQKAWKSYADHGDLRSAAELLDTYGTTFRYDQAPEEIHNAVKAMVDEDPAASVALRDRPVTWKEQMDGVRDLLGVKTDDEMVQKAAQMFGDSEKARSYGTTLGMWQWMHAAKVSKLAQMADIQPENPGVINELANSLETLRELHAYYTGTRSGAGRELQSGLMPLGEAALDSATTAAPHRAPGERFLTAGMTDGEIRSLAKVVLSVGDDPAKQLALVTGPKVTKAVAQATTGQSWGKWLRQFVLGYRVQAMLWNPATHVANGMGNLGMMFEGPARHMWAGVVANDPKLYQMGADMMALTRENFADAWASTQQAYDTGHNLLDPDNLLHSAGQMPTFPGASVLAKAAPTRFLMTSDEFFKQLAYRQYARAQILARARSEGVTDLAELDRRLTDEMKFYFGKDGQATDPAALRFSQQQTFAEGLNDVVDPTGKVSQEWSLGGAMQNISQNSLIGGLIMPFVKTPVQISRWTWERTPILNMLNRQMQADYAAGGSRAALAQAKTEMGTLMWGTAAFLAMNGNITGQGPLDPQLNRDWRGRGNEPYSFRIPGTKSVISFRRGDPFSAALGMAADIVTLGGAMPQDQKTGYIAATVAAMISGITSKTYMQGVSDFFNAFATGRGDGLKRWAANTATSFIPNVVQRVNPDTVIRDTKHVENDDIFPEVENLWNEFLGKIPGASSTLEPMRNYFGEKVLKPLPGAEFIDNTVGKLGGPDVRDKIGFVLQQLVNPFTVASPREDKLADTIAALGKLPSMPNPSYNNMVDLKDRQAFSKGAARGREKQSPYDRMMEAFGTDADGTPSMRDRLQALVTSDDWKEASSLDTHGSGGQRLDLLNREIEDKRHSVMEEVLLKEYPALKEAMEQSDELKDRFQDGDGAGLEYLKELKRTGSKVRVPKLDGLLK